MNRIELHFHLKASTSDIKNLNTLDKSDIDMFCVTESFEDSVTLDFAINYFCNKYITNTFYDPASKLFRASIFFDLWSKYFDNTFINLMYRSDSLDIFDLSLNKLEEEFNISKMTLRMDTVRGYGGKVIIDNKNDIIFEMKPNDREYDRHGKNVAHAHVTYKNVTKDISLENNNIHFYNGGFNSKVDKIIFDLIDKYYDELLAYWNEPVKYAGFKIVINN